MGVRILFTMKGDLMGVEDTWGAVGLVAVPCGAVGLVAVPWGAVGLVAGPCGIFWKSISSVPSTVPLMSVFLSLVNLDMKAPCILTNSLMRQDTGRNDNPMFTRLRSSSSRR